MGKYYQKVVFKILWALLLHSMYYSFLLYNTKAKVQTCTEMPETQTIPYTKSYHH